MFSSKISLTWVTESLNVICPRISLASKMLRSILKSCVTNPFETEKYSICNNTEKKINIHTEYSFSISVFLLFHSKSRQKIYVLIFESLISLIIDCEFWTNFWIFGIWIISLIIRFNPWAEQPNPWIDGYFSFKVCNNEICKNVI